MDVPKRRHEVGRGERTLPGVWRLRLPLPWPGVPHCNAWALAAGDGIVLVDTGMHEPGSLAHLERALATGQPQARAVRLLVCTHAHSDHYGQAAPIVERAGCELWMHPDHEHMRARRATPTRRSRGGSRSPASPASRRSRCSATPRRAEGTGFGIAAIVEPNRDLVPGVEVAPTSAPGRSSRRPATRRRTSASTSPSAAC